MPEDRQTGFTVVEHEMFSSIPGRLLSPGGRAALLDFRRLWMRESLNGRVYVRAVIWTWAGSCDWWVSRKTYGRYQREVVKKGFADVVSADSGHYRASERWRSYSPSDDEREFLEQHEAARSSRCESTRRYRESRKALTTRGQNGPLPSESRGPKEALTTSAEVGPEWPNLQGVKIAQPAGGQNSPDPNTPILTIQPPPTPSQDSTATDSGDVGCTAHFETIDGERTQVWPPPASATRSVSAFREWVDKVYVPGYISGEYEWRHDEALEMLKLLEDRDEKRAAERERRKSDPAYDFMRVSENMQSGDLAKSIAEALGEPQAQRRIERRISGKEEAAREIVAGILRRPGKIHSKTAVFMSHLKELGDRPDVGS